MFFSFDYFSPRSYVTDFIFRRFLVSIYPYTVQIGSTKMNRDIIRPAHTFLIRRQRRGRNFPSTIELSFVSWLHNWVFAGSHFDMHKSIAYNFHYNRLQHCKIMLLNFSF